MRAELNVRSMDEWRKLPGLAEFPGTLYLGDDRDNDPRYPSQRLSQAQALDAQPGLNPSAAAKGAVLYKQEGGHPPGSPVLPDTVEMYIFGSAPPRGRGLNSLSPENWIPMCRAADRCCKALHVRPRGSVRGGA